MLQYAQWPLPVSEDITAPPFGVHNQPSRLRCNDFSCRDQSYLLLKESQQNVHWKIRRSLLVPLVLLKRFVFVTAARALDRDLEDLAEAADLEDALVLSLFRLPVEAARLNAGWTSKLSASRDRGRAVFKASAIALIETASVSGGESLHLCIGSDDAAAVELLMGIGIACPAPEWKYRLRRLGRLLRG